METYDLISKLVHKTRHLFMGNLEKVGLYRGQPKFLFLLNKNNGLTKKEISERLDIAAPTVTKTIERLSNKGFVYTEKDSKDKRVTRVYISEEGSSLIQHLIDFKAGYHQVLLKGIEVEEEEQFRSTLLKVIANLEEYREELHEKNV